MITPKVTKAPIQVWKDGERQKNSDGSWATTLAYRVDGYDESGEVAVYNLEIYDNPPSQEQIKELETKWNSIEWQTRNVSKKFLNSILPRRLRS